MIIITKKKRLVKAPNLIVNILACVGNVFGRGDPI